jgi:hypothetical protein
MKNRVLSFTAESRVQPQTSSYGIYDEVALGQVFLRVLRYSLVCIIPLVLRIHILFVIDNIQS